MIKIKFNQYMKLNIVFITILLFSKFNGNAHHNFGLYYDSSKVVIITGIVKNYSYISPHIEIDLEGSDNELIGQISDRLYDIRCRVVHSDRKSDKNDGDKTIRSGSVTEDELLADIQLIEYAAQQALLKSSTSHC